MFNKPKNKPGYHDEDESIENTPVVAIGDSSKQLGLNNAWAHVKSSPDDGCGYCCKEKLYQVRLKYSNHGTVDRIGPKKRPMMTLFIPCLSKSLGQIAAIWGDFKGPHIANTVLKVIANENPTQSPA